MLVSSSYYYYSIMAEGCVNLTETWVLSDEAQGKVMKFSPAHLTCLSLGIRAKSLTPYQWNVRLPKSNKASET